MPTARVSQPYDLELFCRASILQRALQYRTWSQIRSHFLRQANGRAQVEQILTGKFGFLCAMKKHSVNSA
jgi:hypothetical protein